MTLLLLLSCAWRRAPEVEVDPLAAGLAQADAVWALREEDGGLDRAAAAYEALQAQGAGDPRLLARLSRVRWYLGRAAADPVVARDHYETGRGYGNECLLGFTAFRASLEASRWLVTADAVAGLDASAAPCLTWTAANGLSLVDLRGPGAALEVSSLRPLALRAAALEPDGAEGYVAWVAAVAILLDRAETSPEIRSAEVATARESLAHATKLAPSDPFLRRERDRWSTRVQEPAPAP